MIWLNYSRIFILFFTTVTFSNVSSQNQINYLVQALTEINYQKTLRLALDIILNVIPKSTKVLAFVECGLSNWGALRIIGYVYKNMNVNEIYLVGNSFTVNTQREFKKLNVDRHYLTIISDWPSKEFEEMVKKNYS